MANLSWSATHFAISSPLMAFSFIFSQTPLKASLFCLVFSIFVGILTWRLTRIAGKKKKHPLAGSVLLLLLNFNRLHHFLTEVSTKFRTFRLKGFLRDEIYTAEPENVEYILKTNFSNYGKGCYHYNILTDLLGDGIFTVDGQKWRQQRKILSYEFSTKILRDFSSQVFKRNALKLASIFSQAANLNQIVEIQDLFTKAALDSVFKVILGIELDTICGTSEEGTHFSKAFDEASAITLYRYVDIFWKIKRFLDIGSEARLKKNIKVVDEYVYKLIQSKLEQVQKSKNGDFIMKKEDVLSRLLELEETDPKYLKDVILSFIIAGKDTTASALSWFFNVLCKNPVLQEKIAKEVREATKMEEVFTIDELVESLSEEALEKMQYLQAALAETLRLYPSVPVDGKQCLSDDTFPDGFHVEKGDAVAFQPYAMGRMKFLWGDDAEEFKPERWLNENGVFQPESSIKFTAFQAGPRICLGKEFAYRQMKIFSAVLIGNFKFKLSDETKEASYRTMLTLHIDGGVHACPTHRFEQKEENC